MARTVSDVALLLTAMAGVDDADPAGPAADGKIAADYTTLPEGRRAQGQALRRAAPGDGLSPGRRRLDDEGGRCDQGRGRRRSSTSRLPTYNDWNDAEFAVLLYEFKDGLNTYLKKSGSPHASLEALIAWNKANAAQVMPFFGQEIFEQAQAKGPLTDAAYIKARDDARRLAGKDGLIAALERDKLDALIAPSLSPAWPTDHVLGDHFVGAGYGMAAVAGTPSITVPIGDSHGLPLGITFMGRAYSEGELIGFGYALEQATKARKAPQFMATLAK